MDVTACDSEATHGTVEFTVTISFPGHGFHWDDGWDGVQCWDVGVEILEMQMFRNTTVFHAQDRLDKARNTSSRKSMTNIRLHGA